MRIFINVIVTNTDALHMVKLSQELRQEDIMNNTRILHSRGSNIIAAHTKQVYISQCDVNGHPNKVKCGHCFGWFEELDKHIANTKKCLTREIERKRLRLRYVTHKDEYNQRRKTNKRQPWAERADNPKRAIK